MLHILSRPSKGATRAVLALVVLALFAGSALMAAGEIDCGEALSRCLNDQSWLERLLNPDYCFVGFLFCLFYMQ